MFRKYLERIGGIFYDRSPPGVEKKNELDIARISAGKDQVVFISSYPRSGNTWTRALLADCFCQQAGFATSTKLPTRIGKIIPDRYCDLIAECDTSIETPGLFVKTHDTFDKALSLLDSDARKNMKHVYIYRRPEDVLVSYYHFHRREPHLISRTGDGIDAFCMAHLAHWKTNIESYVKAYETYGDRIYMISYERMLSVPESVLLSLFSWLNIPVEAAIVNHAVSNMSFDNMRANENKPARGTNEYFFRKGKSGGGQQELRTSTLDMIAADTARILDRADRIRIEQDNRQNRNP